MEQVTQMVANREFPIAVQKNGCRLKDQIEVLPLYGRKRLTELNRQMITIKFSDEIKEPLIGMVEWVLPALDEDSTLYRFVLEGSHSSDANSRYVLESSSGLPFKINGVFTTKAYVERGDIIDLKSNRIKIGNIVKAEVDFSNRNKIIKSDLPLFIEGETGTGKGHLAYEIHKESGVLGEFIHLNLQSFSPTLIESELFGHKRGSFTGAICDKRGAILSANYGTLFLDEIDSLPIDLQTKLLLYFDSKRVRPVGSNKEEQSYARVICAAGRALLPLVAEGKFRKDFYFRLTVGAHFKLKPLREDQCRIENIIQGFVTEHNLTISDELMAFYRSYGWPGNIRQLLGHLEKKRVLTKGQKFFFDTVDLELNDCSEMMDSRGPFTTLSDLKRDYAYRVFNYFGRDFNVSSKVLGITQNTLRSFVRQKERL